MIYGTQNAQISQKQDERNSYAIMKTVYPPGYHDNFGSLVPAMCNRTSCAPVHEFPQSDCGDKR